MIRRLRFVKRLVRDLPRQLRLAYCLLRDPRVPAVSKAGFGVGLGLVFSPFIDLPAGIPVIGELDVLALTLLALKVFIATCPADLVAEHEVLILEQRSRFDDDVRAGERIARAIAQRWRSEPSEPVQPSPEVVARPPDEGSSDEQRRGVSA